MSISLTFLGRIRNAWELAQGAVVAQFEELQAQLAPTVTAVDTVTATVAARGAWILPTFAATNFTGFSAQTWTVASTAVATFQYTIIGSVMVLVFDLRSTTVGGTPSAALQIKVPGGWLATASVINPVKLVDNGTHTTGFALTTPRSSILLIERTDVANFTASAAATSVQGQITFPVTAV